MKAKSINLLRCGPFRSRKTALLVRSLALLLTPSPTLEAATDGASFSANSSTNLQPAAPAAASEKAASLRLNFRAAPLNLILDYLSDAAGFIIDKETETRGSFDVWSREPLTRTEAVELLNSSLKRNGYAVIRHGRILTIVNLETAKTSDLEVVSGNDPKAVENSDEVVTQIIPVRYADASQLISNLRMLLPATASLSANESANTLILVAAKTDIRRMLGIISALDSSMASVSSIKIIPVRYADAKQLAVVVQQLFSSQGSSQGAGGMNSRAQLFSPFDGGGFGPPGLGNPPGVAATSGGDSGSAAAGKVTALADEESNSLIVSSPPDLMPTITNMVRQIDQPVTDITELRVFHLRNADPTELADQLAQLFPDASKGSSDQNQTPFRFDDGPPPPGGFGGDPAGSAGPDDNQSNGSERAKKKSRVLAVADPRTASLLVSAASAMMPGIAKLIDQLDASSANKEIVKVYDLQSADPQDISQVLQDLFNRNSVARNNNNSRNSLLGESNPLTARQTQQQTSTTTGSSSSAKSAAGGGPAMATGF